MTVSRTSDAPTALKTVEIPYEDNRPYVLAVLARRCRWLGDDEREAIFHEAYTVMLEKERDGNLKLAEMRPQQVRAYLTQTAINKALDEGKRAERNRTEPLSGRAFDAADFAPTPDEATADRLEGAVLNEIVSELPQRRQAIIKLRFFFERAPDEIQQMLEITSRTYRRELERGVRHIGQQFELVRRDRFCDTRRSAIIAYVAGTADEKSARAAREHMANCPGCTRWAAQMREAARDVAAILPMPAMLLADGSGSRLSDAATSLQDAVANLFAGAKHQATAMMSRLDPEAAGYATAARPGTMAAVVASCIAAGGGATYCAVNGVPEVGGLFVGGNDKSAVERPSEPREARQEFPTRASVSTEPVKTPAEQTREQEGDRTQQEEATESQETVPATGQPAPETDRQASATEFGLAGSAEPVASASTESSSSSSTSSGSDGDEGSAAATEFDP